MTVTDNPRSYHYSDNFLDFTDEPARSRITKFEPGNAAREQTILRKLGINGWGRWQYFRTCFSDQWGESKQRPLSPRSQDRFFEALEKLRIPKDSKASVFLTDEGNLELVWLDDADEQVQIEFGPKDFEVYIEGSGIDDQYSYDRLDEIIDRFFAG
ncbi:MAG: hypothetical protein CMO55_28970 [Verrucomicrobiales bacterium]|nr:hypothetical protein [Verrucomicrobiales bacterium]